MKSIIMLSVCILAVLAQELPEAVPPPGCTVWYDGCHTCQVSNRQVQQCTEEACFRQGTPRCIKFESPDCGSVACIELWDPVCGSDGVTYSNECEFENAQCLKKGLTIASRGECSDVYPIEPIIDCASVAVCTKIYMPVCAANGITYGNECEFQHAKCEGHLDDAGFRIAHQGECSDEEPREKRGAVAADCDSVMCPAVYQPVCASNGKTYSNTCEFHRAECKTPGILSIVSQGECPEKEDCDKLCPAIWDPVCGSDLVTYGNDCELSVSNCRSVVPIRLLYKGECRQEPDQPDMAIPEGCVEYSIDGCNKCAVVNGHVGACTKMFCPPSMRQEPRCVKFAN